jgi:vancomycin resistance protein YoaR
MNNSNPRQHSQLLQVFKHALAALGIGLLLFLFLFLCSITFFQLKYSGRTFPGVQVNEINVGGMSIEEAAVHLTQVYQFSPSKDISLKYLDEIISVAPEELGVQLDAVSTAMKAYQFGRSFPISKWIWQQPLIFAPHIEVAPVIIYDEQTAASLLSQISSSYDQPMVEAHLQIAGTVVNAKLGQVGRAMDIEASLKKIEDALFNLFPGSISLQVSEQTPKMMDASRFIPLAQGLLDQSFMISAPDLKGITNDKWTITPENLAPMLTFIIDEGSASIIPQFHQEYLKNLIISMAEDTKASPENPRFIFNDDTRELDLLLGGINGYSIGTDKSIENIQKAIAAGKHDAELVVDFQAPEISDNATADDLGISELVYMESSYFYGSDTARILNIETAAGQFHGLLVAPGEIFSMANAMGEISLDNGYSEALIIYNGKTIEGVGGGVCQVSTTLFRTAFFSGFPILERHPHAYRVSYYEKVSGNKKDSNLAGLDATVYVPLVDLKFTNDTPYWLLMETYVNRSASRITWKFYSTYDGRSMEWMTTGPTNVVKPKKPLYQLNSDLDQGEIKQIDWEAEGADVTVSRSVYKDGSILFDDSFFTRYSPWRAVYEYGSGTEGIPEPEDE